MSSLVGVSLDDLPENVSVAALPYKPAAEGIRRYLRRVAYAERVTVQVLPGRASRIRAAEGSS